MSSPLLIPGMRSPPWVVPFCSNCNLPVEKFTFLPVTTPYHLEIEAQCCGLTQGARLSTDEIMRLKRLNEKLYLVVGRGRAHHYDIQRPRLG